MVRQMLRARLVVLSLLAAGVTTAPLSAQRGGGQGGRGAAPAGPPPTARVAAPIDLTGYWVSMIVDEWRYRVTPQKGDILYLPLNPGARAVANAWDPDKELADGNACKAYGAVGVMQRPGRLHITWDGDNALKIDTDAGTQTRMLRFPSALRAGGGATRRAVVAGLFGRGLAGERASAD